MLDVPNVLLRFRRTVNGPYQMLLPAVLTHTCLSVSVWLQVADFLNDLVMVKREAAALGQACFTSGKSGPADKLAGSVLALPHHLLRAVFTPLLDARELPDLLDAMPTVLHRALLTAAVQGVAPSVTQGGRSAFPDSCSMHEDRSRSSDEIPCADRSTACLHLRPEKYSTSACAALIARIPMLPPLGAASCGAALPAADLMQALSLHSSLTMLDLAVDDADSFASAQTLADALPSWTGLRVLRLGHRTQATCTAAASDIIAYALADASALTQLDLLRMSITSELARAVGGLTQLAELQLSRCGGVQQVAQHLTRLQRLRTLSVRIVTSSENHFEFDLAGSLMHAGIAACTLLVHLNLCSSYDMAGLELAVLPLLASLHLGRLCDSSLHADPDAALAPFSADNAACRCGLRALPHLSQLTALQFANCCAAEGINAGALSAALPLLLRLARLEVPDMFDSESGRVLAAGCMHAPALRALKCSGASDMTLLQGAPAAATHGLTSLVLNILERAGDPTEVDRNVLVATATWWSGAISQLSALRELCIVGRIVCVDCLAARPTLEVLARCTNLRRLELTHADVRGVDWGAASLCGLSALCLRSCAAPNVLPALAPLTKLRYLSLLRTSRQCSTADVAAYVRRRDRLLLEVGTLPPQLEIDLNAEDEVSVEAFDSAAAVCGADRTGEVVRAVQWAGKR